MAELNVNTFSGGGYIEYLVDEIACGWLYFSTVNEQVTWVDQVEVLAKLRGCGIAQRMFAEMVAVYPGTTVVRAGIANEESQALFDSLMRSYPAITFDLD